jgi:hypothetical protein
MKADMTALRTLALCFTGIIATAPATPAQTAEPTHQSATIAPSIALEKDRIPVGEKPKVTLLIYNISHSSYFSHSSRFYQVHLEGKDGEPAKTELYRHMLGDFRPGDGPELMEGPDAGLIIAPGSLGRLTFDLTAFYYLSTPGKYSVYLEYLDSPNGPSQPGVWLRTNTLQFEITHAQ